MSDVAGGVQSEPIARQVASPLSPHPPPPPPMLDWFFFTNSLRFLLVIYSREVTERCQSCGLASDFIFAVDTAVAAMIGRFHQAQRHVEIDQTDESEPCQIKSIQSAEL